MKQQSACRSERERGQGRGRGEGRGGGGREQRQPKQGDGRRPKSRKRRGWWGEAGRRIRWRVPEITPNTPGPAASAD